MRHQIAEPTGRPKSVRQNAFKCDRKILQLIEGNQRRRKRHKAERNITPCLSASYVPCRQRKRHREQRVKTRKFFITRHDPPRLALSPFSYSSPCTSLPNLLPSFTLPYSSGGGPGGTWLTPSKGQQQLCHQQAQVQAQVRQDRQVTGTLRKHTWSCRSRVNWVVYNVISFPKKRGGGKFSGVFLAVF